MHKIGFYALLLGITVVGVVGGYSLRQLAKNTNTSEIGQPVNQVTIGDQRPDFILPDLDGRLQGISRWDGKVLLINFWASWCPPCVREIPALQKIYRDYRAQGVEVVGIALDEPQHIRDFLHGEQVTYPLLHGQLDVIQLMGQMGNKYGTLPYTVVVNRAGDIAAIAQSGELDYAQIQALLDPLLKRGG